MDFTTFFVIAWFACFLVVSIDSAYNKISPVFWRLAGLAGGPFALLAYCLVRERKTEK